MRAQSVTAPDRMINRNSNLILLTVILAVAFFLRANNLWHGVGIHPDERGIIMDTERLSWQQLKPNSFHYGSLVYHLLWFSAQGVSQFDSSLRSYDGLFRVGRGLAVLLGLLAILLTYHLGKIAFGDQRIGIMASAFLALNTFHLQLSRFYTADIIVTACAAAALIFICKLAEEDKLRYYLLAGLFIGLGFTAKISALTLLLPLWVAGVLRSFIKRCFDWRSLLYCAVATVMALGTVVLVEPYVLTDYSKFVSDNMAQINMLRGNWKPPYALQYEGTVPYLYHLEQMLYFTIGAPIFVLGLIGLLAATLLLLRRPKQRYLILIVWIMAVFLGSAGGYVKFPRYLLPIYPAFICFAAWSLVWLLKQGGWLRRLGIGLTIIAVMTSAVRAVAFSRIYSSEHIYTQASRWIFENVPAGSVILGVHWDDKLPHSIPGFEGHRYFRMEYPRYELPLFEPESPEKMNKVLRILEEGDYLVLPTERTARGLLGAKRILPDSARLFQLLYAGELGYKAIATLKVYPNLGDFRFNDDLADESLLVYDHPKVMVFRNVERLSADQLLKALSDSSGSKLPSLLNPL